MHYNAAKKNDFCDNLVYDKFVFSDTKDSSSSGFLRSAFWQINFLPWRIIFLTLRINFSAWQIIFLAWRIKMKIRQIRPLFMTNLNSSNDKRFPHKYLTNLHDKFIWQI